MSCAGGARPDLLSRGQQAPQGTADSRDLRAVPDRWRASTGLLWGRIRGPVLAGLLDRRRRRRPLRRYLGGWASAAGNSRGVAATALTAAGSSVQGWPVRVQAWKFDSSDASWAAASSAHASSRSMSCSVVGGSLISRAPPSGVDLRVPAALGRGAARERIAYH